MKISEFDSAQFYDAISIYLGLKQGYGGYFPWKAVKSDMVVPEKFRVNFTDIPISKAIEFPRIPTGNGYEGKEITLRREDVLHALSLYFCTANNRNYKGNIVKEITLEIPSEIKFTLSYAVENKFRAAK